MSERDVESYAVYLVRLDPTVGAEMNKARPCVVVSPESMHRTVKTVIIAPLTSQPHSFPTRVACRFEGRNGQIALDQLRAVDRRRLLKRLGQFDSATAAKVREAIIKMFK